VPASFEFITRPLAAHSAAPSVRSSSRLLEAMMKRLLTAFIFLLLAGPAAFAGEQSLLARVTVYWASGGGGSDRWSRRHICSTGARLQAGHCAVDPRRIPYGSKVALPDATLLAVDTGSAVVSRKAARRAGRTAVERSALVVDRFFETKQQALNWARRNPYFMFVRVSPPDFRNTITPRPASGPVAKLRPPVPAANPAIPVSQPTIDQRQRSSRYAR
jgi:3D (Asp-Asp-Asp) domain-containing protein